MTQSKSAFSMQRSVRGPWRKFVDATEPWRPALHKYCHGLTGNVWDAEDLAQDVLLRVFGQLGKVDARLENPRAYLIRTATNMWIDRIRRSNLEKACIENRSTREEAVYHQDPAEGLEVREAVASLFDALSPQQRAAVLLKDVFDLSLAEIAGMLKTSVGAVKSALHRGRDQLREVRTTAARNVPPAAVVEAFMEALSAGELDKLQTLCSADVTIELVGGCVMESFQEGKSFFKHAHMVFQPLGFGANPHWKTVEYRGEILVVGFRTLDGVEGVNEIHRIETTDGKISSIRCYCFCPDTLRAVAADLGLVALDRPYRSPTLGTAIKSLALGWVRRPFKARSSG